MLRVREVDRSLHEICHPNAIPPRRSKSGGKPPSNKKVATLFREPFIAGTPRTPDWLTTEAYIVHSALKRTLLYQVGNAELVTSLQQWLLL